ncbi:DUF6010 family protein [Streptomyces sp. NPDC058632]|uniref:DUF6010 family protein n=1 Tax=unclassified Streptomyces TaxID=2593676 RepID=UPI00364C4015
MLAGAGAARLDGGGSGGREFALAALVACVAFRGLDPRTSIGIGRLLHTAWDIVRRLKGAPILPFSPPRRRAARSATRWPPCGVFGAARP